MKVSEWTGCYLRDPEIYFLGCPADSFSNAIEFNCIYNSSVVPTQESCLNSTFCPFTREEVSQFALRGLAQLPKSVNHRGESTVECTLFVVVTATIVHL